MKTITKSLFTASILTSAGLVLPLQAEKSFASGNPASASLPERPIARRTKTIERVSRWVLPATPAEIFPLLCPVREYDWLPWWRTELVNSVSGYAEADCIFRTALPASGPAATPRRLTWVVSRYEPTSRIEFTCFAADLYVMRLKIALQPAANGTQIEWTHTWLSLGPDGDKWIESWSEADNEARWAATRDAMEYYLRTGTMRPAAKH